MTRRITSLGVHRAALIGAIIGAVFALVVGVLVVPFAMMMRGMPNTMPGFAFFSSGMMLVIMPITYFVIGYILTAIWVALFNLIAPRIGGIPITFADEEPPAAL